VGDDFEEAQRKMDALQEQQTQLLAQLRKDIAALPAPDPRKPSAERRQECSRAGKPPPAHQDAGRDRKAHQRRKLPPKKRYISPATREEVYAVYYDQLRRKVEDKGTVNFPEYGGKKLYGELVMILTVNHDGRVLGTEIVQGSGNSRLDRQAEAIAVGAGPFGSFNPDMRQKADQIAVVSRFKFTRDQTLETSVR
jgi:protein TonB